MEAALVTNVTCLYVMAGAFLHFTDASLVEIAENPLPKALASLTFFATVKTSSFVDYATTPTNGSSTSHCRQLCSLGACCTPL